MAGNIMLIAFIKSNISGITLVSKQDLLGKRNSANHFAETSTKSDPASNRIFGLIQTWVCSGLLQKYSGLLLLLVRPAASLLIKGGGRVVFLKTLDFFQGSKIGVPIGCLGETSIFKIITIGEVALWSKLKSTQMDYIQYNINTYKAPYVTKKLFVGTGVTRD